MFYFHTKHHYKIWFSKEPNVFLDIENQLDFISSINRNPNLVFRFVYSSKRLNEAAREDLKSFCSKYKIIAIDFDTAIPPLLVHEYDKQIYATAQTEIERALQNQGGNLASASDFARFLAPVISSCGIYGDFDLDFNFSSFDDFVTAKSPFLMKMRYDEDDLLCIPGLNNDRIAFAVCRNNPTVLADESLAYLRRIQHRLLLNHRTPAPSILRGWHPAIVSDLKKECGFSHVIATNYFLTHPNASFFDWRKFIADATFTDLATLLPDGMFTFYFKCKKGEQSEQVMKNNFGKHLMNENPDFYTRFEARNPVELAEKVLCRFIRNRLQTRSVVSVSGPQVLYNVIELPENPSFRDTQKYVAELKLSDIDKCFTNAYIERPYVQPNNPLTGAGANPSCRLSWTSEGSLAKKQRVQKVTNAARLFQFACRNRANDKPRLWTLSNETKLSLLAEKYNLLDLSPISLERGLRNAAGNNQVTDLKIFIRLGVAVDAQDSNPRVKKTALHWAAERNHTECYELLKKAGAKDDLQDANGNTALELRVRNQVEPDKKIKDGKNVTL